MQEGSEGWGGCGMVRTILSGSQGITKESRLCSDACFDTLVDSPILPCSWCPEEWVQKNISELALKRSH